ncbi:MAG TPA: sulfatase [Verrucomicrobiae bacterium]|nr:sulfatase [Verrucomicrobiae bacterium]
MRKIVIGFYKRAAVALFSFLALFAMANAMAAPARPNVLVVIADQWRFEALGFAGNPDVKTPNLDRLAHESVRLETAVSGLPVCTPMRASFMTGQRPLTDGVFMNDVALNPNAETIAKVFRKAGYDTGYVGKWHLNGDGRSAFIPPERRQGFDYWKVLECTHDYNHSFYYANDPVLREWEGYDAIAQTRDVENYLRSRRGSAKPFFLVLAWGPPHSPYNTAPKKFRELYKPDQLSFRPNVPGAVRAKAGEMLAGYYAHCSALDACLGGLWQALREAGLDKNTILLFTSDHGDMLGSHDLYRKQKPYDESIRVPLLVHWPAGLKPRFSGLDAPINSEDLMPTILGLCRLPIPKSVQGKDFSRYLRGGRAPGDGSALITCIAPFGEWSRQKGGKEFRGLRTARYTYCRDLHGAWLLFDDRVDPFQTNNLAGAPAAAKLVRKLDKALVKKLAREHDEFLSGDQYIQRFGYVVNSNGTVPYAR